MDDNVKDFEQILMNTTRRVPCALYNDKNKNTSNFNKTFSARDVIEGVNEQIKAINRADTLLPRRNTVKRINKYKKSSLLSVNMLPRDAEVINLKPANKFETQCMSDTQLIDIVDNIEAIANSNNGMTQEFDSTFCEIDEESLKQTEHIENNDISQSSVSNKDISNNEHDNELNNKRLKEWRLEKRKNDPLEYKGNKETKAVINSTNTQVESGNNDASKNDYLNQVHSENTQMNENCINSPSQSKKTSKNISLLMNTENFDDIITPSPIFQVHKSKSPSPLVFDLGTFENFEKLALPIIQENPDLSSAKQLINSQIIGTELHLGVNIGETIVDEPASPVLKVNREHIRVFKTPHANMDLKSLSNKDDSPIKQTKECNDTFLQDEILFSSDEEDDYIQKELQDIPLTCALQTSFYEQPDVLDKTMYVGFQTASNRSIQINTDSFSKAKSLLEEIERDVASSTSLTELVESLSTKHNISKEIPKSNSITFESAKIPKKDDISKEKSETEMFDGQIDEVTQRADKRKFEGFITASNKRIKLSDLALARCKRVFQDIDLNEDFKDTEVVYKENGNESNSHIDDDILQEFSRDMSLMDEEKNEDTEFVGFKTASKKEIKISEEALARTKKVFDDIDIIDDVDIDSNKPSTSYGFCGFKTANHKDIKVSNVALLKSNAILQDIIEDKNYKNINDKDISILEANTFVGFKTAGNKNVQISKKALLKTRDIFKDIDEVDPETIKHDRPKQKISPVKSNTLRNDMNQIDDEFQDLSAVFEDEIMESDKETIPLRGFQTASSKPIKISEKALHDSKKLFDDLDLADDFNEEQETRPNPVILKKSQSESKLDYEKISDCKIINEPKTKKVTSLVKDKNSKSINIPEGSLQNSDCDSDLANIKVKENVDTTTNNSECFDSAKCQGAEVFKGFHTANNRPINVSKKVLARVKDIFKDLDSDSEIPKTSDVIFGANETDNLPAFSGFKTANNKLVTVSSDALAKSKSIFKDIEDETNDKSSDIDIASKGDESYPAFKGFQTANNKKINVSSEALARSKLLFKDIDSEQASQRFTVDSNDVNTSKTSENAFKGFQTANYKPVAVSAEALARSKQVFKDIDQIISKDVESVPKFDGFKTANQKPVSISTEALAKSKALFKDIDDNDNDFNDNHEKFNGFQTASNKVVKVSEDALLKSKRMFEDIDGFKENEADSKRFRGFQTASNRKVNISEEALKKTRQIFQDIEFNDNTINNKVEKESTASKKETVDFKTNYKIAFKTANRDNVAVSKDALRDSKLKLNHTQNNCLIKENNKSILEKKESIEKLIDTQMVNDFEQTLHTEDFCKETTPRQCKRSGSPIFSCPKAKRRKKFETPYRNDGNTPSINELKTTNLKSENGTVFNTNYKKNKRLKLKDLDKVEENTKKAKIDPALLNYDLNSFSNFEFCGHRNDLTEGTVNMEDLKEIFRDSVNKKLIPIGWLENHLKLIIWKLISYEIRFPKTLSGVCKVKNVLEQLKYRFDKELYNAERPALRKILEKDDVASKTMVLCVAEIFEDGVSVKSVANLTANVELLLTDGWYCVKASIDKMLTKLVYDGKIYVGRKIMTAGAELVNCEQGVSPWEDTSSVRLKIFGNSTRPARWDARLGYHGNGAILVQLSAVTPEGGKVSKLRVFVARTYPMLYVEKFEDGSTVTRSERLEHIHQAKYETERQSAMEKLYEEVEKELSDQESQDSLNSQMAAKNRKYMSDSRITESQAKSLEDRSSRKRERLLEIVQERVRKKIQDKGLDVGRNVVTLLKVRVAGLEVKNGSVAITKGLMSIWKPNELLTEIIRENTWIDVLNVVPTAVRYSEIQLSAGRQSIFSQCQNEEEEITKPYTQTLKRTCYNLKDLAQNSTMTTDYNEVDTIGLIFQIDEESNQPFQNMYLTDSERNIICVNFWGGLKKFGFQNILEAGEIVYGTNLQRRAGNTRKSIPHFRVTEFTFFTKTPKSVAARNSIQDLEKKLVGLDKKKYCSECVNLKNSYSTRSVMENVTPYRVNNDHNLSKNKMFIDSPLTTKCDDIFNLTGLDFESTFQQTEHQDLSPKMLQRKKLVKQKIARLKMIGEPPPLSPLNIINKSKSAMNSYKSPLATANVTNTKQSYQNSRINKPIDLSPVIQPNMYISDQSRTKPKNIIHSEENKDVVENEESPLIRPNVTSVKKCSRIDNEDIQASPVFSMNRTYVKNVNPVKLNFSNVQDNSLNDEVDHFAEEFDGSPPLSLD